MKTILNISMVVAQQAGAAQGNLERLDRYALNVG